MAESVARQIVEAVAERLRTIEQDGGVTYWYTPDRVIEWEALTEACLDRSLGTPATVYVVSPGEPEESTPATLGGKYLSSLPLDISLCRWIGASEDPFAVVTETRGQAQDRMLRDMERRLVERDSPRDLSLGVEGALEVMVRQRDRSAETTHHDEWAIAVASVRVQYQYSESEP